METSINRFSKWGILIICLGALIPLNVLYHELRFYLRSDSAGADPRIAEFESFRQAFPGGTLVLHEPAEVADVERQLRRNQAQYALVPAIVLSHGETPNRLLNRALYDPADPATPAMESKHYLLYRSAP